MSSPLAIDVFDALRIAIEVDSVDAMFEFSEILVKKSCDKRFFEGERLKKLKNYPERWSKLMVFIDEVQANLNNYWNVELKKKFELLYDLDQDIRNQYVGKTEFGDYWTLVTAYQEQVKIPFLELMKEYGIKGEKELGVYIKNYENEKESLNQAFPAVIMLHIAQSGESRFTKQEIDLYYKQGYMDKLMVGMIKGNLDYKNSTVYKKTNEMIRRGASEDSIIIQVREDWRMSQGE